MRLADFIECEMEAILSRWEEFAGTLLPAARNLDRSALRDHAEQILRAIATDLRTPQTRAEQRAKSRGEALAPATETAAQTHAVLRAGSGFSVRQLVSEYRALRASVLRQYLDRPDRDAAEPEDIGRFNEAIDQAVAESVDYFSAEVDRWRNIFLGVLAHDLRGPLNSMLLTVQKLATKTRPPEDVADLDRLAQGGRRMTELLDDLLDFSRVSMGGHLEVQARAADLVELCRREVELQCTAHPSAQVVLSAPASCAGVWDASRISQAVGNLIGNAIKYGKGTPIEVRIEEEGARVSVSVENHGPMVDAAERDRIFDPLYRGSSGTSSRDPSHLGLGLFIVRHVAESHGGTVEVHSDPVRTCFAIILPRDASVIG